jgi:hypothetical protein
LRASFSELKSGEARSGPPQRSLPIAGANFFQDLCDSFRGPFEGAPFIGRKFKRIYNYKHASQLLANCEQIARRGLLCRCVLEVADTGGAF